MLLTKCTETLCIICINIYMHVCMHACIHTERIHACMHAYVYTYDTYIHTYIHTYDMHTYIRHTYIHVQYNIIFVALCVCVCVCVFVIYPYFSNTLSLTRLLSTYNAFYLSHAILSRKCSLHYQHSIRVACVLSCAIVLGYI